MPTTTVSAIDTMNDLLSASLAAQETYRTAIEKIEKRGERGAIALRVILENHVRNSDLIRKEVLRLGGQPDERTGAWGLWARANESVAAFFGDESAVIALEDAERHGIRVANEALESLEGPSRHLVEDTILVALGQHEKLLHAILEPL